MASSFKTLASVIENVVRERFGQGTIESVEIKESKDFDGDGIFIVDVVFTGKGPLDDEKTSSVIRYIRRALREHSEERFPVISFTSEPDAAGRSAEAA